MLDSYAWMTLLHAEPGASVVRDLLTAASEGNIELYCSWVNITEVYYLLQRRQGETRAQEILVEMQQSPVTFVEVTGPIAIAAARLKAQYSIALGDAFAAGTALALGAEVVTGDREFAALESIIPIRWLPRGR